MSNFTHARKYRRTTNYGQGVAPGVGVWNDRGRSLISKPDIENEARRGAQMYAATMQGNLLEFLANEVRSTRVLPDPLPQ